MCTIHNNWLLKKKLYWFTPILAAAILTAAKNALEAEKEEKEAEKQGKTYIHNFDMI